MYDLAIIGGGIAGVGLAAALPPELDVVLLEAESQWGAHSTGRSAALFYPEYGHPTSRPLAAASRDAFESAGALGPRGLLTVAADKARHRLEGTPGAEHGEWVEGHEALAARVAVLRPHLTAGVFLPDVADLDVMAAHAHLLATARANGVSAHLDGRVMSVERASDGWHLSIGSGDRVEAGVIVDAAGAWADQVAALAGVAPVGLEPRRRTIFVTDGRAGESERWPAVADVDHAWYFKPQGPQLLCSPAEEVVDRPGDPRPRPLDIALGMERINEAAELGLRSVRSAWTGLRTFSRDEAMVIGPDPADERFFWLAGQGGSGIQTAPGAGRLAAALLTGSSLSGGLAGVDPEWYAPARFAA